MSSPITSVVQRDRLRELAALVTSDIRMKNRNTWVTTLPTRANGVRGREDELPSDPSSVMICSMAQGHWQGARSAHFEQNPTILEPVKGTSGCYKG